MTGRIAEKRRDDMVTSGTSTIDSLTKHTQQTPIDMRNGLTYRVCPDHCPSRQYSQRVAKETETLKKSGDKRVGRKMGSRYVPGSTLNATLGLVAN